MSSSAAGLERATGRVDRPRSDTPSALTWRVLRDPPASGVRNMALDHALALSVGETGGGVLRLYGWSRPTISLGRNEVAAGRYSIPSAAERGVDFVRRPTGGRAVLHADELTYALVVPVRWGGGPRAIYRRVNAALAEALRALGAEVEVSNGGAALPLDAGACFRSPVEGEVVVGDAKVVGSAQARVGGALLQHGSILLSGEQRLLAELSAGAVETSDVTPLAELVGPVDTARVADAVATSLKESLGGSWSKGEYSNCERSDAERLASERYALDEWTWRR